MLQKYRQECLPGGVIFCFCYLTINSKIYRKYSIFL